MPLSPEVRDAANKLRTHAQQLQAILTIAGVVNDIEKLEQLSAEAETTLAGKRKELEQFGAKRRADIDAEFAAASSARKTAREAIDQAKADAEKIMADARADARKLIDAAEKHAGNVAEESGEAKRQAEAAIAGLKDEIAAKTKARDKLSAEVAELEARSAKAREFIASLAKA